jgi:hypothetical protein
MACRILKYKVSHETSSHQKLSDLRANNSQNERPPRQTTIHPTINLRTNRGALRARRTASMTFRARQNSYRNERSYKEDIEDNQEHAQEIGAGAADSKLEDHGDERIEDCCCQDAFDGTIGTGGTTGEADDLGDAEGEED